MKLSINNANIGAFGKRDSNPRPTKHRVENQKQAYDKNHLNQFILSTVVMVFLTT